MYVRGLLLNLDVSGSLDLNIMLEWIEMYKGDFEIVMVWLNLIFQFIRDSCS